MREFHEAETLPAGIERNELWLDRHPALAFCLSMIFSENRFPLFRIMLSFLFEHDLFGKPVSTFPDHALAL
jgi:hypothetical protein